LHSVEGELLTENLQFPSIFKGVGAEMRVLGATRQIVTLVVLAGREVERRSGRVAVVGGLQQIGLMH
jgi:hypothetical protein